VAGHEGLHTVERRRVVGRHGPGDGRSPEDAQHRVGQRRRQPTLLVLGLHAVEPDLVQLVEGDEGLAVLVGGHARHVEYPGQHGPVVQAEHRVGKPEGLHRLAGRGAQLGLDHRRRRSGGVHITLVELAEATTRRAVGPPHRLDLVALEVLRQRAAMLGDDARQRHGEVVPEGQVGLSRRLVLAALQDLEDELVALLAVLAEERLDVLDGRCLERLEAVALVDGPDDADHVGAATNVGRQEIPHAAGRRCGSHAMPRRQPRPSPACRGASGGGSM
jgi:hypothetical protein